MSSDLSSIESQFNINLRKSNDTEIYEFDRFRLDAAHLMLYENDAPVSLAPKVIETLVALVERRGEIVSKQEMMSRLWADSFVEESNLTQNIYLLRKTLGKSSDGFDLIETFRRRGYRFNGRLKSSVAETEFPVAQTQFIEINDEANHIEADEKTSAIPLKSNRNRLFLLLITTFCGLILFATFGWVRFNNQQTQSNNATDFALQPTNLTLKRLTPNESVFSPVISPDGKFVTYSKLEGKEGNGLWLKNLSTGEKSQLLPPVVKGYMGLQFSPDGKSLYFLNRIQNAAPVNLACIPVSGGKVEEVVANVPGRFAISPDGSEVTFVRDFKLIIAQTDGSGEKIIAERDGKARWFVSRDSQPAWSPDGEKIAVCGGYTENGRKYPELVEIDTTEGTEKRIHTPNWNQITTVAWLSSGTALLVTAREEANKPLQIWRLSYPDGAVSKVTNDLNNYDSISLTADSKQIVAEQIIGQTDLWMSPLDNVSHSERLAFAENENIGVVGLAFTPDGRIIYSSAQNGNLDLWIMNPDGSNQKQLTTNMGSWNGRPQVTSNSRYIVFQSTRSDKNHIWRIDSDGNNPLQLTNESEEQCPSISPDGQWIYYNRTDENNNRIFKVSINGGKPTKVSENNQGTSPSVSPDGKLIAFETLDRVSKVRKVGIMLAETGKIIKEFDFSVFRRTIRWTPDSKSLIYIPIDSANLWQQPIDGSAPIQLTDFGIAQAWNFAVSKDSQKLIVARGNSSNEAVLIGNLE